MAPAKLREYVILAFCGFLVNLTFATPVSISLGSVSDLLIQSALKSLNDTSPTHHTYKSGNLISAQKLLEPSYVIYRLTLNLEPNCNKDSPCPREACAIDLRQHEQGVIDVQRNSIQCMYLYPQSVEADVQQQQPSQDSFQDIVQEQEPIEIVDKRVINESVQLDHEVQTVTDDSDRPFIAVRAMDRNYCAGCAYELNPTLPGLSEFGEQVVQSMDATGRNDFKHKVVSIVKVTRAVPPGSNLIIYELLLEIGQTNCVRIGLTDRKECSLLINVPIQLCLVTFEQRPWQQDSRKIVRNNCTELPDSYNELNGHFEETVGTSEPLTMTVEAMESATSYGSSIDDFFKTVEHTSTARSTSEDSSKIPVTEKSMKKIVVDREEEKRDRQGFINKVKEFDAFLEDFDVPIKNRDPEPTNQGVPVTEEIIRPEIVTRENSDQSNDGPASNHGNEQRKMRKKRSIFDGMKDETNLVKKLAQKAVDELDEIDVDDNKRVLLAVIDWKKHSGNGTVYYVTMKVAVSNCTERKANLEDCLDDIREPAKICKAQIYVNEERSLEAAKILQSQCFDELNRRDTRFQRDVEAVGAPNQLDPNNEEVKHYVEEGLSKYSETSGLTNEPFLFKIVEATTQIVSGTLYKIRVQLGESTCPKGEKVNCQLKSESQVDDYLITVWSRPWMDGGNPDIKINLFTEKNAKRVRRSDPVLGGSSSKNIDDPEIRDYAEKGLRKYSETSGLTNEPILVEIVEATSQVVSGMLYTIKVRLGESNCPKGKKGDYCSLKEDSKVDDYLITVWSQPWIDHGNPDIKVESLKEINAKRVRRSNTIPGGDFSKDTNDPEIRDYVEKGLHEFSKTSGLTNEPFLAEIVEAKAQVVSGMLYKIKVRLGESTCPKGKKENCSLKNGSQVDDYLITVWSQPWMDHGNPEINIEIFNKNKKVSKRGLRGKNYNQKMLKMRQEYENERAFDKFTSHYEKSYPTDDERNLRFKIFSENMKRVKILRETEQGTAEYGATIFADLTQEEFRSRHLGFKPELRTENDIPFPKAEIPDIELPTEFDWRQKNVVTEVKDQGACGSCWAFAVTGNVEGLNAIKHGKLLSLSEQELVDCDTLDQGCAGGLPDNAYRSLETLGGLELESDYPYDAENEKCHFDKTKARVSIVSGLNITSNETQMAQWLVQNGPIAIGINANAMQFYMGGVSHPFKFLCNGDDLDHGVLIVGYGIHTYPLFKKKMPYWIIKNSWGKRWGEQGYYRVYRGDGTCGLNRMASSAVIA